MEDRNIYFFFIFGIFVFGFFIGWLITYTKNYTYSLFQESQNFQLERKIISLNKLLINEKKIRNQLECNNNNLYAKLTVAKERILSLEYFQKQYNQLNKELILQKEINGNQVIEIREMRMLLKNNKKNKEKYIYNFSDNEEDRLLKFKNLINKIFSDNSRKINEYNCQYLDKLLIPLKEQLDIFYKQIRDNFNKDSCERNILIHEIHNLQKLNIKISQEAVNLTQALKGNNKIQGNWGELILSQILESSGLREGYEFETQIKIKGDSGKKIRPDVIVHLPKGRNVIIDSKMSLLAYEKYFNSNNDNDRRNALLDHINSLRSHIKSLSNKNYQRLLGLNSLDYVLMFIPVEPAFITAINAQPNLINEALSCNIIMTSPSTLLVALKTINNLWIYENQSKNAKNIAERASRLYDKLRLFIEDINTIGISLDKAQNSYYMAKNKLFFGKGNIVSQAEKFSSLGVKIKQPISNLDDNINSFNNLSK